jgi:hypothetical protein
MTTETEFPTPLQMADELLSSADDDWQALTHLISWLSSSQPVAGNEELMQPPFLTLPELHRFSQLLRRTVYRHHLAQIALSPDPRSRHEPIDSPHSTPSSVDPPGRVPSDS